MKIDSSILRWSSSGVKRLSRSHAEQDFLSIGYRYQEACNALDIYFSRVNPNFGMLFAGLTSGDVIERHRISLEELELDFSLTLLAAMEAALRIDFAQRCEKRLRDPLSREFRRLHRQIGPKVHLEDDIISGWESHTSGHRTLLNELRQAFRYRHWLAHGRYWLLKVNVSRFRFNYLYLLSETIVNELSIAM